MKKRANPLSKADEVLSKQAKEKRKKRQFYLESTLIALGSFALGCLVKYLLSG